MRTTCGFVLPVVLGVITIAGLLAAYAVSDSGVDTALATHRVLHQEAFEAAEAGIATVVRQITGGRMLPATQMLPSTATRPESAVVAIETIARRPLPPGFSAGIVVELHQEIRSTGHSVRNTEVTVVQGVRRLVAEVTP